MPVETALSCVYAVTSAPLVLWTAVVAWAALAVGVGTFAANRGHSFWIFVAASLALSPLTMFFIALVASARTSSGTVPQPERLDRLQQIVQLRDAGALTPTEFEREKALALRTQETAAGTAVQSPAASPALEPRPGNDLDPSGGLLELAAACMRRSIGTASVAAAAAYVRSSDTTETVGEAVHEESEEIWRDPVGWLGGRRPRGLVVATEDQLLWSSARREEYADSRSEQTVTIRSLPITSLLAARADGKQELRLYVDEGPTLRFRVDSGASAEDLARHLEERL